MRLHRVRQKDGTTKLRLVVPKTLINAVKKVQRIRSDVKGKGGPSTVRRTQLLSPIKSLQG